MSIKYCRMFTFPSSLICPSSNTFFSTDSVKSQHFCLFVAFKFKTSVQRSCFHNRTTPAMGIAWCTNLVPIVEYRLVIFSQ